jgi:hypothetical protein
MQAFSSSDATSKTYDSMMTESNVAMFDESEKSITSSVRGRKAENVAELMELSSDEVSSEEGVLWSSDEEADSDYESEEEDDDDDEDEEEEEDEGK